MKREFLTYEQSLDMRAIGFNEPCLAYYDKDGDFLGDISVNEDTDNLYTNADFVMYQDFKVADVSAPTFSQAFRWFREKYDLFGVVEGKGYDHKRYYVYSIMWFYIYVHRCRIATYTITHCNSKSCICCYCWFISRGCCI